MDFFSKLGKKASETYKVTKEKATTITEELKIKGKISDAKDKIEDLYKEIGEKVFEEVKSGKDVIREDILEKVEQISNLKNKIEKYETEILALKKIKRCQECNTELELDAEYCSKCGKQQEKIEVEKDNQKVEENNNIDQNPEVKEAEVIEVKNVEDPENTESFENKNDE